MISQLPVFIPLNIKTLATVMETRCVFQEVGKNVYILFTFNP